MYTSLPPTVGGEVHLWITWTVIVLFTVFRPSECQELQLAACRSSRASSSPRLPWKMFLFALFIRISFPFVLSAKKPSIISQLKGLVFFSPPLPRTSPANYPHNRKVNKKERLRLSTNLLFESRQRNERLPLVLARQLSISAIKSKGHNKLHLVESGSSAVASGDFNLFSWHFMGSCVIARRRGYPRNRWIRSE